MITMWRSVWGLCKFHFFGVDLEHGKHRNSVRGKRAACPVSPHRRAHNVSDTDTQLQWTITGAIGCVSRWVLWQQWASAACTVHERIDCAAHVCLCMCVIECVFQTSDWGRAAVLELLCTRAGLRSVAVWHFTAQSEVLAVYCICVSALLTITPGV